MCTYYYCEYPVQLLANMLRHMFLDQSYKNSINFSSMEDKLAISIGFDKSNKDFLAHFDRAIQRMGTLDCMSNHLLVWKNLCRSATKMESLPSATPHNRQGTQYSTSLMTSSLRLFFLLKTTANAYVHVPFLCQFPLLLN